jgi:hypothetical protein
MSLIGLIILFAMAMHKREISKYDNAVVAKARVTKKESEEVWEGKSHSTDYYLYVDLPIGTDTAHELVSHDYMDEDVYTAAKKGSWINVVYLKESIKRTDNGGIEVSEKIYSKEGLDAASARLPWYWLYAGVCVLIGLLPFILKRKKKA